jgi:glycosylphosphatidylinositol phospholipase D
VSGAGDVNGDGFDDVLIGAPDAAPNGISLSGQSYVVIGAPTDPAALLEELIADVKALTCGRG